MKNSIIKIVIASALPFFVLAQADPQNLQENIQDVTGKIQELEEGIKKDQQNLNIISGEKQTLSKAVSNLSYSERILEGDIKETEEEIEETEEEIENLSSQITTLAGSIDESQLFIQTTIQELHKESDTGLWEAIFLYDTFSEFLDRSNDLSKSGKVLGDKLQGLKERQEQLQVVNNKKELARYELENQIESLSDRKEVVELTKIQKANLLRQTKNKEQNYQASLAEKRKAVQEFEKQIQQLELELRVALDRSAFQGKLTGLFNWPFKGWYRITQFFGNTSYASGGAYNGRGHSGVDFATPMGTPILSPMDGVITAADDTGKHGATVNGSYKQCISYGKWVVINHENGLSTRMNHLSLIKVTDGQRVRRGQIIGYSGNTGISTGPHLHISVAATQGVQIKRLGEVIPTTACRNARAPIIAANAYLDPFDYLPRPKYSLVAVKQGDRGANVRNLQMMLKHERIFPIEISANGIYGPNTAQAVAKWQKKYRVEEDGGSGKVFSADSISVYNSLF